MDDAFSFYKRGMSCLLEQLLHNETAYKDARLLQLRLERNLSEARIHGAEPTQKNELSKILGTVDEISMQITKKSFYTWCASPLEEQSYLTEEMKDIEKYLGKLSAFYSQSVHQDLTNQLIAMGARPKASEKFLQEDMLERYTSVPLHAIFLYTSQDELIAPYILNNWGTLDTLSGDVCDIHPVLDQFKNREDAYNYLEQLDVIIEANFKTYSKLPGIFFWDQDGGTEYVPFGKAANSSEITYILRVIFEAIRLTPNIASIISAKSLLE